MVLQLPSPRFIEIAKTWHDNEDLNHWTGFGRGEPGKQLAKAILDDVLTDPDQLRFYAIYEDMEPVGYLVFTDLDGINKSADLHITLSPTSQGAGYGPTALRKAVDLGFNDGLYRITFKPLVSNKRAIQAAFKAGFKLEARTKFSVWTDDGPQDQAQMRVVKPEWRKRNHT